MNDVLPAVRAWWSTTPVNAVLARRGAGVKLMPHDFAALAARAIEWQDQLATNSAERVRDVLVEHFGPMITRMESRGDLTFWDDCDQFNETAGPARHVDVTTQGMYARQRVHLFAKNIPIGGEVGLLLHESGMHAGIEKMLGPDGYKALVQRAHDLMYADNALALHAVARIPLDTPQRHLDAELLAYLTEVAATAAKPRKPWATRQALAAAAQLAGWTICCCAIFAISMTFTDYEVWLLIKAGFFVLAACVYGAVNGWRQGRAERAQRDN